MKEFKDLKQVKLDYDKASKPVHFGNLRAICHEKHSELPKDQREYKGRVVFRGDTVKDIDGYYAVFSEQGTSSSHMAATKFIDAIVRMPGMDGEGSDAMGAYTQVCLIMSRASWVKDASSLIRGLHCLDISYRMNTSTWIRQFVH